MKPWHAFILGILAGAVLFAAAAPLANYDVTTRHFHTYDEWRVWPVVRNGNTSIVQGHACTICGFVQTHK
jgi:hypothetical protein